MPQLPQQWNNSTEQASLAPVASSPEYYIPLWWYSGSYMSNSRTVAGYFVVKGSGSDTATLPPPSNAKLHTLSSNWSPTTKYAFEVTAWAASGTLVVELWDTSSGGNGSAVSGSQISTSSTTATVIRSGQFTLIPGHIYAISLYGTGGINCLTDASLIVFP